MMMMKKLFVILSAIMFAVVFAIPAGADAQYCFTYWCNSTEW